MGEEEIVVLGQESRRGRCLRIGTGSVRQVEQLDSSLVS
jgi:hypothetical protein